MRLPTVCGGYEEELATYGVALDDALVTRGDWQVESGYMAASVLLDVQPRPTAIFAGNDLMAVGAMYAIFDAGLRVAAGCGRLWGTTTAR